MAIFRVRVQKSYTEGLYDCKVRVLDLYDCKVRVLGLYDCKVRVLEVKKTLKHCKTMESLQ